MTNAIQGIESPIMTIATKGKTGSPTLIMLLSEKGSNDAPLYVVLEFYSDKPINGKHSQRPHVILTVAERNFFEARTSKDIGGRVGYAEIINNAIAENRILSFDKKRRTPCQ